MIKDLEVLILDYLGGANVIPRVLISKRESQEIQKGICNDENAEGMAQVEKNSTDNGRLYRRKESKSQEMRVASKCGEKREILPWNLQMNFRPVSPVSHF